MYELKSEEMLNLLPGPIMVTILTKTLVYHLRPPSKRQADNNQTKQ